MHTDVFLFVKSCTDLLLVFHFTFKISPSEALQRDNSAEMSRTGQIPGGYQAFISCSPYRGHVSWPDIELES